MTSLTEQQQELVARNLFIVHWVICDYIHVNPTIFPCAGSAADAPAPGEPGFVCAGDPHLPESP